MKFLHANRIAPDGTPHSVATHAFCSVSSGAMLFPSVP